MARGDIGLYKTNSNAIPAVVLEQFDSGGVVVGDAGGAAIESVDVLLLGVDQGKRYNVPVAASRAASLPNQFAF